MNCPVCGGAAQLISPGGYGSPPEYRCYAGHGRNSEYAFSRRESADESRTEVEDLKAKVAELEQQLRVLGEQHEVALSCNEQLEQSRENFRAAHAIEEKLRREAELERDGAKLARNSMMNEADAVRIQNDQLTGYVRRLREALIAHTPPMFMREIEALLKETE